MDDGTPTFSADSTCPQILRIPLALLRFRLSDSHTLRSAFPCRSVRLLKIMTDPTPVLLLTPVWPLPLSLATTRGISFDFSSSGYLDVSVPRVPRAYLFDSACAPRLFTAGVPPFGNLRVKAYLQLTAAFRSLSRPSSAPNAKAFSICSSSLELLLCVLSDTPL